MKRVMFYCQHVLGMGHFIRSTEIVRGLTDFAVSFLNGGEIVEGFALPQSVAVINLPPIRSDAEFRQIQTVDESVSLAEIKASRTTRILAEYERLQPDVLIIELFPFGRRKFAFELLPLLERIQANGRRTKVVCSLRDILVSKRDQTRFDEQVIAQLNQFFDLLLVHSDPAFQRLDETFRRVSEIRCPIHYTGFVTQPGRALERGNFSSGGRAEGISQKPDDQVSRSKEIVVSIGGGRVGGELIECALTASELLQPRLPHRMQIYTGPYMPDEQFRQLQDRAGKNADITLARFTTEFVDRLSDADLSLSMAGYNTCLNIVTTGIPAIVYPFTGNHNEEQTIRAEKLQRLGIVEVITAAELAPERLALLMWQVLNRPGARPTATLDLNGVASTANAIAALTSTAPRYAEITAS